MNGFASNRRRIMGALAMLAALTAPAAAQDKVKVGVFPVSSTLPYFVAVERGLFKEQNIETEMVRLIGGPPNVAAMITNQIDASAVLVTIEGMNANIKKPGVAMYISVNSQNRTYQMEQFVARKGYHATSLKDLKGAKIMSAPGPANVTMAKAALAAVGLKEGDYSIDQLDMGQHVNAMTAGTFDAGYTLEPSRPSSSRPVLMSPGGSQPHGRRRYASSMKTLRRPASISSRILSHRKTWSIRCR